MQAMSDAGQRQGEQMNAAAANVQGALDDMHSGLNGFVQRLDQQMNNIAESNRSIMQGVQKRLTERIDAQQQQANKRDQALISQIEQLQGSQGNLDRMIETQTKQQKDMLEQILVIVGEAETMANHNQAVGNQLGQTAAAFEEQVPALLQISQSLREASTALAGDIRGATQAAQALMQQNQRIGARSEEMLAKTRNLSQSLLSATNTLGQTVQQSTAGLQQVERHFKALAERLKEHSDDFSKQVAKLLSDYTDQVSGQTRERLNEWNKQTQEYTTAMTNAIQALNEVVDEMEGRVRQ